MWFQCLITILRQFFKSICTTKQSDGKCICCALITDYYNPMNKHLSCQHLQYELLPPDCDPICISPHAIFHVKKSLSRVLLIKCEKSDLRGVDVDHKVWKRQTQFNRNIPGIWGKSGWRPCLHIIPPFALFLYTFVPSSSTSQCSVQAKMPKTGLMIWHTAL